MITILKYFNHCFNIFFLIEAIIKIIGLGTLYFRILENVFDFIIVIVSITATAIDVFTTKEILGVAAIFRVFRVGRTFKLFRNLKSVHLII